jgi:SNF2 family DNA or RNA helicase
MRVILTGTPVTESPFDLWSMFEFLYPNYFNCNYYAFKQKHGMFQTIEVEGRRIQVLINYDTWARCKKLPYQECAAQFGITLRTYDTIQQQTEYTGPYIGLEALKQQIDKVSSFVKIEDIADMPEKMYNKKVIDMPEENMKVYKDMERKFVAYYQGKTVDAKAKVTVKLRLQQIASGFITSFVGIPEDATDEEVIKFLSDPPPREVTWFDKKPKVDQLVADLEELGHNEKAVILTHFTAEAAMLYDTLVAKGFSVNLQTGWKKVGTIESFKEGKEKIMVANTRVVSKGFNFQANCNHLYYYSNTFSLEDRQQSEARIYRLGQSKTCIYTDYCMKGTVDEDVFNRLKQKEATSEFFWTKDDASEDELVDMPVF